MQRVARLLMRCAVRNSGYLVADNQGIHEYIKEEYGRNDSVVIAYGGDQSNREQITPDVAEKYPFVKKNAVAIARIQSDNNVEMLLEYFKDQSQPLVYIGNWNVTPWLSKSEKNILNTVILSCWMLFMTYQF